MFLDEVSLTHGLLCGMQLGWIEDRTLSQHSMAAAARSWFKPSPNQGSTFISRCHYSPAAVWQMALWDIEFYGRSSFISNFFSHLMRSSRSSQIHFAVWILIGLALSLSFSLSLPLSLSVPTSTASLLRLNVLSLLALGLEHWCLVSLMYSGPAWKTWINMRWSSKPIKSSPFINSQFSSLC